MPAPASADAPPSAQREPDRFSAIVRDHSRYVWRVVRCLGVREADIEDLCQDTFMVVHRKLPSYERQVFVLYEVEAVPMREVCEAVGCPLQTAYSRLHAARKQVADELARLRAQGAVR